MKAKEGIPPSIIAVVLGGLVLVFGSFAVLFPEVFADKATTTVVMQMDIMMTVFFGWVGVTVGGSILIIVFIWWCRMEFMPIFRELFYPNWKRP